MPILNYTTKIPAEKTGMQIQKMLVKAGAVAVLMEFDDLGIMESISFRTMTPHGLISFRLPANIDGVFQVIANDSGINSRAQKTHEQAVRVGWRILKDWVEAQLAIIEAGMAELTQVFLPYAQDQQGKTVFESISQSGFKQLTDQTGE